MGQTVNLLAKPSEVRILLSPPNEETGGSSSSGRAKAFQALGSGFEPRLPLFRYLCLCSSVVEHFLGREEVVSSILTNGSDYLKCKAFRLVSKEENMKCATQQQLTAALRLIT